MWSILRALIVQYCYRTFPFGLCLQLPVSSQRASRSFFRVIYVRGPLKSPQPTTTPDTLTPTRYSVLSLIYLLTVMCYTKLKYVFLNTFYWC